MIKDLNNATQAVDTSANVDDTSDVESANIKNEPKLIISSYEIKPKMVEAGKNFQLALTLYNTNSKYAIYNLKVSLDQNLQSQPQTSGDNNSLVSDGSVFSPVNSSNTYYVNAIYPWNYSTKYINMNVLPNAQAGSYVIGVNLEYEDYLGNKYTTTESIGIPVVQKAQITAGAINVDGDLMVGSPASVSMDIYNTGKDTLSNFMMRVVGDGLTVDEDTHFVGNFTPGSTENFSFNITPEKEGKIEGKIVITCEDSTGKEYNVSKNFKKEVMSMGSQDMVDENGNPIGTDPETGEMIGDNGNGGSSFLTSPFTWIGLIAIIMLIIFLVRKKNKKKKEEELTIDED